MDLPDVYQELAGAIDRGDVESGVAEARRLVDGGTDLVRIFKEAIEPLMQDIGDRFSRLELFLPEMMLSALVVKGIQEELADTLAQAGGVESRGKVVMGTASGDIHDIGKNMVIIMLEVNGFDVINMGVNVEPLDFVKKAREVEADIIGISSLLTSSVPYMTETVQMIKEHPSDRERFKVAVGGGPVNAEFAESMGADAYGEDASDAVTQMTALLQRSAQ
ncbi:MAG: cobalamin-dependent protein [Acidimicrobiia bacterium]|nr:cobalamin-dependent protein [Acidimicrobiia bacterium]